MSSGRFVEHETVTKAQNNCSIVRETRRASNARGGRLMSPEARKTGKLLVARRGERFQILGIEGPTMAKSLFTFLTETKREAERRKRLADAIRQFEEWCARVTGTSSEWSAT